MKKTILIIIFIIFIFPNNAFSAYNNKKNHHHKTKIAEWHGTPAQALSIAEKKAYKLWNAIPCKGNYHVEMVPFNEIAGEAIWDSPTGAGEYTLPPSTWTACVMRLRESDWTSTVISYAWPEICTVVLHEWGHLTGHPHSDEPGQPPEPPGMTKEQLEVMRSGQNNYSVDSRCGWEP